MMLCSLQYNIHILILTLTMLEREEEQFHYLSFTAETEA